MKSIENIAVYVRVSTENQIENYSIDEQIRRLKSYCAAKDWTIIHIYPDSGYSGGNTDRPGLKKLLADIKTGVIDAVVVYKLDRLSRSQKDTLTLIEDEFLPNNVDFVSINENFDTSTPFGRAMIGILSVFAQLEKDQITERFTMGRIGRSRAGYFHGGGNAPMGYDYVDGELVVNEYEASQVREAYKLLLSGHSVNAIHRELRSKYGRWTSPTSTLTRLRNSIYIGMVKFKGIEYKGAHDPIIDVDTYNIAQELLNSKERYDSKSSYQKSPFRFSYLLSGMIFCKRCGAKYSANHGYYKCYSRAKSSPGFVVDPNCKNDNWCIEDLDAYIINTLMEIASNPAAANRAVKNVRPTKRVDTEKIARQIDKLDKQLARLLDLYQVGSIPMDALAARVKEIDKEKDALQKSLEIEVDSSESVGKSFEEAMREFSEGFSGASLERKRLYISSLIQAIEIDGKAVKVRFRA